MRARNANGIGPWSAAVTGTVGPATVTIAGDGGVNEGFNAEFILTASKPVLLSSKPLDVSVSVSESEDMVASAEEGAKTVSFAMGNTTATLSVPTVGDGVVESDSVVTAAIQTNMDYTVGTDGSGTVSVIDQGAVADDCADDTTTTCSVSLGSSVTGNIEVTADSDYFSLSVTSGVTYQIDLEGSPTGMGTLANPKIWLRDASRTGIGENSSGGTGLNARLIWTADRTGTVYVQAYSTISGSSTTGTYTLTVSVPATDPDPEPGIAGCGRSHWDRNKSLATQLRDASCEYQARSRNILADGQVSAQELAQTTPLVTRLQEIVDEFPCGSGPYRYYDLAGLQKMWKGPAPECLVRTTKSGGGGLPWQDLPAGAPPAQEWTENENLSPDRGPRGLTAEATAAGNVLAWQAPQVAAGEVTGYRVLRARRRKASARWRRWSRTPGVPIPPGRTPMSRKGCATSTE